MTTDQFPRPIAVVTGYFDLLHVEHLRALAEVRRRNPDCRIVVFLLSHDDELVSQAARARMVAAIRVVDYVLIADQEDPDAVLERLQPAAVVRLEEADERRNRLLIEHVQRRQEQ